MFFYSEPFFPPQFAFIKQNIFLRERKKREREWERVETERYGREWRQKDVGEGLVDMKE